MGKGEQEVVSLATRMSSCAYLSTGMVDSFVMSASELEFEKLLTEHLPGLRAFVRGRAQNALVLGESCEDVVQSACFEVFRNIERFQHGGEAGFRSWLYMTALRKLGNRQRKQSTLKRDPGGEQKELHDAAAAGPTPSEDAVGRENLDRVMEAMDSLSQEHRDAILLAKLLEMPRAEVGQLMGRSEEAVRSLLHRAIGRLGLLLGEDDG